MNLRGLRMLLREVAEEDCRVLSTRKDLFEGSD